MEQHLGTDIEQLDINIRSMALTHLLLKGCVECKPMQGMVKNFSADSARRGLSIRETIAAFQQFYKGNCNGQKNAEHSSPEGCMPEKICGDRRGPRFVTMQALELQ